MDPLLRDVYEQCPGIIPSSAAHKVLVGPAAGRPSCLFAYDLMGLAATPESLQAIISK